jgi:hypothetical protein
MNGGKVSEDACLDEGEHYTDYEGKKWGNIGQGEQRGLSDSFVILIDKKSDVIVNVSKPYKDKKAGVTFIDAKTYMGGKYSKTYPMKHLVASGINAKNSIIESLNKNRINEITSAESKKKYPTYKGPLGVDDIISGEVDIEGTKYFVIYNDYDKYSLINDMGIPISGLNKDGKKIRFPDFKNSAKEAIAYLKKFVDGGGQIKVQESKE